MDKSHSPISLPLTGAEPISSCTALVLYQTQSLDPSNHPNLNPTPQVCDRDRSGNGCERHKHEIKAMQDQYHTHIHQLRIRAEGSEADWKRLDARLVGLKSEVENISLNRVPHILTSDMSAQTDGAAGSHDQLLAEVISWRTTFMNIPGTATQKAAAGKAAIDELKKWHAVFNNYRGTIEQKAAANEEIQLKLNDWTPERTGPPRSEVELNEQLKDLQDKFDSSAAYAKRLQEEVKSHEAEDARQKIALQQLLNINSRISSSLKREQMARETLIDAFAQYKKATTLGSDCEALSTGVGATPSICDTEGRSSQQEDAPPVAPPDKATGPESSNKRKRDTTEVDSQPNDAFQSRKRMDFSDQKMPRREGSRRTDASQPVVQVSRDPAVLWRAPALNDASIGQRLRTRNMEISNTTLRFPTVQNPASVPVIRKSALAASQDVEAASRDVGDAEGLTQVRQSGSPVTVLTPELVFPVERKWKHSMLRRG